MEALIINLLSKLDPAKLNNVGNQDGSSFDYNSFKMLLTHSKNYQQSSMNEDHPLFNLISSDKLSEHFSREEINKILHILKNDNDIKKTFSLKTADENSLANDPEKTTGLHLSLTKEKKHINNKSSSQLHNNSTDKPELEKKSSKKNEVEEAVSDEGSSNFISDKATLSQEEKSSIAWGNPPEPKSSEKEKKVDILKNNQVTDKEAEKKTSAKKLVRSSNQKPNGQSLNGQLTSKILSELNNDLSSEKNQTYPSTKTKLKDTNHFQDPQKHKNPKQQSITLKNDYDNENTINHTVKNIKSETTKNVESETSKNKSINATDHTHPNHSEKSNVLKNSNNDSSFHESNFDQKSGKIPEKLVVEEINSKEEDGKIANREILPDGVIKVNEKQTKSKHLSNIIKLFSENPDKGDKLSGSKENIKKSSSQENSSVDSRSRVFESSNHIEKAGVTKNNQGSEKAGASVEKIEKDSDIISKDSFNPGAKKAKQSQIKIEDIKNLSKKPATATGQTETEKKTTTRQDDTFSSVDQKQSEINPNSSQKPDGPLPYSNSTSENNNVINNSSEKKSNYQKSKLANRTETNPEEKFTSNESKLFDSDSEKENSSSNKAENRAQVNPNQKEHDENSNLKSVKKETQSDTEASVSTKISKHRAEIKNTSENSVNRRSTTILENPIQNATDKKNSEQTDIKTASINKNSDITIKNNSSQEAQTRAKTEKSDSSDEKGNFSVELAKNNIKNKPQTSEKVKNSDSNLNLSIGQENNRNEINGKSGKITDDSSKEGLKINNDSQGMNPEVKQETTINESGKTSDSKPKTAEYKIDSVISESSQKQNSTTENVIPNNSGKVTSAQTEVKSDTLSNKTDAALTKSSSEERKIETDNIFPKNRAEESNEKIIKDKNVTLKDQESKPETSKTAEHTDKTTNVESQDSGASNKKSDVFAEFAKDKVKVGSETSVKTDNEINAGKVKESNSSLNISEKQEDAGNEVKAEVFTKNNERIDNPSKDSSRSNNDSQGMNPEVKHEANINESVKIAEPTPKPSEQKIDSVKNESSEKQNSEIENIKQNNSGKVTSAQTEEKSDTLSNKTDAALTKSASEEGKIETDNILSKTSAEESNQKIIKDKNVTLKEQESKPETSNTAGQNDKTTNVESQDSGASNKKSDVFAEFTKDKVKVSYEANVKDDNEVNTGKVKESNSSLNLSEKKENTGNEVKAEVFAKSNEGIGDPSKDGSRSNNDSQSMNPEVKHETAINESGKTSEPTPKPSEQKTDSVKNESSEKQNSETENVKQNNSENVTSAQTEVKSDTLSNKTDAALSKSSPKKEKIETDNIFSKNRVEESNEKIIKDKNVTLKDQESKPETSKTPDQTDKTTKVESQDSGASNKKSDVFADFTKDKVKVSYEANVKVDNEVNAGKVKESNSSLNLSEKKEDAGNEVKAEVFAKSNEGIGDPSKDSSRSNNDSQGMNPEVKQETNKNETVKTAESTPKPIEQKIDSVKKESSESQNSEIENVKQNNSENVTSAQTEVKSDTLSNKTDAALTKSSSEEGKTETDNIFSKNRIEESAEHVIKDKNVTIKDQENIPDDSKTPNQIDQTSKVESQNSDTSNKKSDIFAEFPKEKLQDIIKSEENSSIVEKDKTVSENLHEKHRTDSSSEIEGPNFETRTDRPINDATDKKYKVIPESAGNQKKVVTDNFNEPVEKIPDEPKVKHGQGNVSENYTSNKANPEPLREPYRSDPEISSKKNGSDIINGETEQKLNNTSKAKTASVLNNSDLPKDNISKADPFAEFEKFKLEILNKKNDNESIAESDSVDSESKDSKSFNHSEFTKTLKFDLSDNEIPRHKNDVVMSDDKIEKGNVSDNHKNESEGFSHLRRASLFSSHYKTLVENNTSIYSNRENASEKSDRIIKGLKQLLTGNNQEKDIKESHLQNTISLINNIQRQNHSNPLNFETRDNRYSEERVQEQNNNNDSNNNSGNNREDSSNSFSQNNSSNQNSNQNQNQTFNQKLDEIAYNDSRFNEWYLNQIQSRNTAQNTRAFYDNLEQFRSDFMSKIYEGLKSFDSGGNPLRHWANFELRDLSLGLIRTNIQEQDRTLRIAVEVDDPAKIRLISDCLQNIRQDLSKYGYENVTLDFNTNSRERNNSYANNRRQRTLNENHTKTHNIETDQKILRKRRMTGNNTVDLTA